MDSHAVVIGAGMAGLAAARVLSDRYSRVTVLDRDELPAGSRPRRGVPQSSAPHILLVAGREELSTLFPGLSEELVEAGGSRFDTGLGLCTYRLGRRWPQEPTGMDLVSVSRPQLEAALRRRVTALPGVIVRDQVAVSGLTSATAGPESSAGDPASRASDPTGDPAGRAGDPAGVSVGRAGDPAGRAGDPAGASVGVTGVILDNGEVLHADLVVDGTGRGARSDRWLSELGLSSPAQLEVKVGVAYSTRIYRRRPDDLPGWDAAFVLPTAPEQRMSGLVLPIEDDRWLIAIGGWHLSDPPTDPESLERHARELPDPIVAEVMSRAEPLGDPAVFRFPSSRRRLFEQLESPPAGYVALGDAVCSFNPIYGQGMTCAAMSAVALGAALDQHGGRASTAMARAYYARVAEIVQVPWQFAVGGDFVYPQTTGPRPRGIALRNWYSRRIAYASQIDAEVNRTFVRVQHLVDPPSVLTRPGFALRVLRKARERLRS
ncbi:NAD(P)-binding protein [Paractinoplanes bogorensis]|uniref:NAD(P)-binding protein n=1 Tax=Paractinoplanes bogorensis TaxID=1610840 RepID=UPI0027DF4654|nr:NAD(P)-binding protein [Actinoplanes bogorensis]